MKTGKKTKQKEAFNLELNKLQFLSDSKAKWVSLERLHIIGQSSLHLHLKSHFLMLSMALKELKFSEILGQLLRLFLVIPGHILGRLPKGNVGTTRVSAFREMEVPEDLRELLD